MSKRNSVSNVEGGDTCHTCQVLESAIKGLNLKSDFYNSTRCIHNNSTNAYNSSRWQKLWKDKSLTKSAENISCIPHEPIQSSRSEKITANIDRSSYSLQTVSTFALLKDGSTRRDMSPYSVYIEEDPKYKNLTPFEIKLQKDIEAYQVARREAFEKWLKRKEAERRARNKGSNKPVLEAKISPEEREETFRRWCAKKKQIKRDERERREMEERRREEERKRALEGKEEKIREWCRKKDEIKRETRRRKKEQEQRIAMIKEMRKRESEEAYKRWLRQSKHKPLPVPLNKGELSMKGSLTKMYVNPEPWKHSVNGSSSGSTISN